MGKKDVGFATTDTGYTIASGTFGHCNRIDTGAAIDTTGSTLTHQSNGQYVLYVPNVTVATGPATFFWSVTADPNKFVEGIINPSLGDEALQSTAVFACDLVESQRGHHTWSGSKFYVAPVNGNDTTGNGSRLLPYKTVTKALSMCVNNNHDLIILVPDDTVSPTVLTEDIAWNKSYTFLRGPGRDFKIQSTAGASKNAIVVSAHGCELSGFVTSSNGNAGTPIKVSSADFTWIHDVYIESPTQDCIEINVGTNTRIQRCTLLGAGRDAIRVSSGAGSGYYTTVEDCIIRDAVGNAVNLLGTDASECRIQRNVIRDNANGVSIASGVADTIVTDNRFINNTGGDILDSGTRTLKEFNSVLEFYSVRDFTVNDASATTTKFISTLTEATNDFWNNEAIQFRSGQNAGQIRAIKNYAGSNKQITLNTAASFAPANGDKVSIIRLRAFRLAGLSQQEIADSLQLAPVGVAADGSVGEQLAQIVGFLEGEGNRSVTIQLYITATTTPIADATITVMNSLDNLFLTQKTTDVNGRIVMARNDGTYKLRISKAGYTFTTPETLTVAGSATHTFYGTGISIPVPAAGLQTLYGNIRRLNWALPVGEKVYATIIGQQHPNDALVQDYKLEATIDAAGQFTLTVPQAATIRFEADRYGFHEITTTTDATKDIVDYL